MSHSERLIMNDISADTPRSDGSRSVIMSRGRQSGSVRAFEWPTLFLAVVVNALFWGFVLAVPYIGASAYVALAVVIALSSSLQHELLHGHPFRSARLNACLVPLPYSLFIPYWRFRALHIAHHDDPRLTDPYEDPESWYLHPRDWKRLGPVAKWILQANTTLVGRVLLGPAIGLTGFYASDVGHIIAGRRDVLLAWMSHGIGAAILLFILSQIDGVSLFAFGAACYAAHGLLCVRTYLEHQAAEDVGHRTVLIEDRGPLAWLFLFNSLHGVHHALPGVPWYELPRVYRQNRALFQARNGYYVYRSYWQIIRRYAFRSKEAVPHPFADRQQPVSPDHTANSDIPPWAPDQPKGSFRKASTAVSVASGK